MNVVMSSRMQALKDNGEISESEFMKMMDKIPDLSIFSPLKLPDNYEGDMRRNPAIFARVRQVLAWMEQKSRYLEPLAMTMCRMHLKMENPLHHYLVNSFQHFLVSGCNEEDVETAEVLKAACSLGWYEAIEGFLEETKHEHRMCQCFERAMTTRVKKCPPQYTQVFLDAWTTFRDALNKGLMSYAHEKDACHELHTRLEHLAQLEDVASFNREILECEERYAKHTPFPCPELPYLCENAMDSWFDEEPYILENRLGIYPNHKRALSPQPHTVHKLSRATL